MTEAYTNLQNTLRFYGKVENNKITQYGSQIPFNFELISKTSKTSTAVDFKTNIDNWINGMPKGKGIEANWVVSAYKIEQSFYTICSDCRKVKWHASIEMYA